jgi:alpha-1,2-mannosyltransferase
VFAASLTGFLVVNHALGFGGYDLTVYLAGGEAFRHGTPVYDATVHSHVGVGYFMYPPVTLLLFAPMSLLPLDVAHAAMIGFGMLTLLGVITLSARLVG